VNPDVRPVYHRWILANAWSEAVGLGSTLVFGRVAASTLDRHPGPATILAGAGVAILAGILLEGLLVGWAQARVLRAILPGLAAPRWVRATALGAGAAWLLGMLPSTLMALQTPPSTAGASPPGEPPALVQYALAVGLGAITGPVLGLGQWLVLRREVPRAARWIPANAAAWAVGMVVIFVGMDRVPWQAGGIAMAAGVYAVCALAGAAVGAIHGRVLLSLPGDRA
jgi:hypothetical protein